VTLQRVGDEPRAARRLRLRADDRLLANLGPAEATGEVARLRVPCRESVTPGDRIVVELSFGPMVDEVELDGKVAATIPAEGSGPPTLVIAFEHDSRAQLDYVQGVLAGLRSPSARAHRRIPVDVGVHWRCGELHQQTRARDLSRGGAFVLSHLQPPVNASVEVELEGDGGEPTLRLAAVVSWVQRQGSAVGFGVRFVVRTRPEAEQLHRMVRAHAQHLDA